MLDALVAADLGQVDVGPDDRPGQRRAHAAERGGDALEPQDPDEYGEPDEAIPPDENQ